MEAEVRGAVIQELERGEDRATISRLAGRLGAADRAATPTLENSQAAAPQEPSANRGNNRRPVATYLMSGRYPEGQRCLERRLVIFLGVAILCFSFS